MRGSSNYEQTAVWLDARGLQVFGLKHMVINWGGWPHHPGALLFRALYYRGWSGSGRTCRSGSCTVYSLRSGKASFNCCSSAGDFGRRQISAGA